MVLQYFKKKENEYKYKADIIYIDILERTKLLINQGYLKENDFDSSFEIISIFLIFYFKYNNLKSKQKINDELMSNFINDLDKSFREIGIGDMSIGKYVKKYVKKFYYRLKILDTILNKNDEKLLSDYLNNLNFVEKLNQHNFNGGILEILREIKKKKSI